MVEVEGEWYYVDVTWADTGPNEYFLMGSDEFTLDHYAFNDYLNLPTASKDNYNFWAKKKIKENLRKVKL